MISDFLFIALLILANGFFAAVEMAVVSARQARLQSLAEQGDRRAQRTLQLRENSTEFLATVQIGITLVGTLASAVGGVEAVRWLSPQVARIPLLAPYAGQIALAVVVLVIAFASLLFGELVPKRLAIRSPERLAMMAIQPFEVLTRIFRLPGRVLMLSTDLVLRLLGAGKPADDLTSPAEIEVLVRRGAAQGVLLPVQERMIARVFDYADRSVKDEMTPRLEIVALDANTKIRAALKIAKKHGFSRFPVYQGDIDHILGYVHIKDLIWASPDEQIERLIRSVIFIPEGVALPQAFTTLTRSGLQMGIVMDEYGGTEGLITLENLLEVIVGEIEDEHSPLAESPHRSGMDEWSIAGGMPIVEVAELLGVEFEAAGQYNTLAGFLMAEMGAIPQVGDSISWGGYCFTVTAMERMRVVSVQVRRNGNA
jgi:putative hemolysin